MISPNLSQIDTTCVTIGSKPVKIHANTHKKRSNQNKPSNMPCKTRHQPNKICTICTKTHPTFDKTCATSDKTHSRDNKTLAQTIKNVAPTTRLNKTKVA